MAPYKSRKHTYLKKHVDSLFIGVIFNTCKVSLIQLTEKDISNYKLSLIQKNYNTLKEDGNITRENNTSKIDKRPKDDKKSNDVKTSTDVRTSKDIKTAKENTSIDDEPAKKKQKVDTNGIGVHKLVLSREGETKKFKPQLKPIKEVDSTSTREVPMAISCEESTKSENSFAKNVLSTIWVKDIKKMMDRDQYIKWLKIINFKQTPNHLTNDTKEVATAKLSTCRPKVNGGKHVLQVKKINRKINRVGLAVIEELYKKYFCKSVNDNIIIIANVLNIISISNKYHKEQMIQISLNKINEYEKLKERHCANRLHKRHTNILETKLKKSFGDVSSFEELEFDLAFQMFFLSILTVLRVLDQKKFKQFNIFKHTVVLLKESLQNSKYDHPQMYSLLQSEKFRSNCINLMSEIENSRDNDPGVTDRMPTFFLSRENSLKYFQAVIKAVTTNSKEDLEILIDNAVFQCSINSINKDPVDSSTVTETIQSPINSDEIIQQLDLAKNPDETYQHKPVLNINKSQTIGNTTVKPLIVKSQPLNNSNQSFSSPLQNKTYVSSTSTSKFRVVTPNFSHRPLVRAKASLETPTTIPTRTTFLVLRPPMQSKISVANSHLRRAESSTLILGDRQYQFVNAPIGQMKAEVNCNNPQPEPTVLNYTAVKREPTVFLKCYARNCNNTSAILCIKCQAVQYCSYRCLEHDWYDCHNNNCEQVLKMRRSQH